MIRSILFMLLILSLQGCALFGDSCGDGGTDCCCDNEVVVSLTVDTDFFPINVRQQLIFAPSDSSKVLVCYTNGRGFRTNNIVIGEKHKQEKCGDKRCDYNLALNFREIDYLGDSQLLIFSLTCDDIIKTNGRGNYKKYAYTAVKRNFIRILSKRFYFASPDFNVLDSNQIIFHSSLSIDNTSYNNVYELVIDSNKVLSGEPYKCYYSGTNDGILGFDTRNGPTYRRIN